MDTRTRTVAERPPLPDFVQQHAEEAAMLRHTRAVLVRAPHVRLHQLRRLDDRIAAHLDGLSVAGPDGTACCVAALERPGVGEVFALAVHSIELRDDAQLDKLFALCPVLPEAKRALFGAFGWVSSNLLQGLVRDLLGSADPLRREVGLAACRMHQVDPGPLLTAALADTQPPLRVAALRAAGELGRRDLIEHTRAAMIDADEEVVFWAAWSSCLLGDRRAALRTLSFAAERGMGPPWRGIRLLLAATEPGAARELAAALARRAPSPERWRLRMAGLLGDARALPALIDAMSEPAQARLAGEAFSLITGADLAALDLECAPPENMEFGPNDDPADDNVDLDEDEDLPWPDAQRVQRWWQERAASLPDNAHCFLGAPLDAATCRRALREGFQRQRLLAAERLCLQEPGQPLFAAAAPAWRQQRLLAL